MQFLGLTRRENDIFIVTEWASRGDLRRLLYDPDSPPVELSWLQRAGFALDLAQALAYLHARKIVHRDVKVRMPAAKRKKKLNF